MSTPNSRSVNVNTNAMQLPKRSSPTPLSGAGAARKARTPNESEHGMSASRPPRPTDGQSNYQPTVAGLPSHFLLKPIVGSLSQPVGSWGASAGSISAGQRRVNSSAAASLVATNVDPTVSTALLKQLQPRALGTPNIDRRILGPTLTLDSPPTGTDEPEDQPPPIPLFSYPEGYGARRLLPSPSGAASTTAGKGKQSSTPSAHLNGSNTHSITLGAHTDAYVSSNDRSIALASPMLASPVVVPSQQRSSGTTGISLPGESLRQVSVWPATNVRSTPTAQLNSIDSYPGALTRQLMAERDRQRGMGIEPLSSAQLGAHHEDDDEEWEAIVGLADAVLEQPIAQQSPSAAESRSVSPGKSAPNLTAGNTTHSPHGSRTQARAGAHGRRGSSTVNSSPYRQLISGSPAALIASGCRTPSIQYGSEPQLQSTRGIKPYALEQLEQLVKDSSMRLRFEFPAEHQAYMAGRDVLLSPNDELPPAVATRATSPAPPLLKDDLDLSEGLHAPVPRRMLPVRRFNQRGVGLIGAAAHSDNSASSPQTTGGQGDWPSPIEAGAGEDVSWEPDSAVPNPSPAAGLKKSSSFRKVLPKKDRVSPSHLEPGATPLPLLGTPTQSNPLTETMKEYLSRRLQSHRDAAELFLTLFESYRPILSTVLDEYEGHMGYVISHSTAEQRFWKGAHAAMAKENSTLVAAVRDEQAARANAEKECDGLRAQVAVLRHAETALKEKTIIFEHEQHMNQLQAQQSEAEKTALTRKMMALEEVIEGLNHQLSEPGKAIEKLNAQLIAKNSHIQSLSSQNDKIASENASLKRQVTARAKEHQQLFAANALSGASPSASPNASPRATGAATTEDDKTAALAYKLQESAFTISQLKGNVARLEEQIRVLRDQTQRMIRSGIIPSLSTGFEHVYSEPHSSRRSSVAVEESQSASTLGAIAVVSPTPSTFKSATSKAGKAKKGTTSTLSSTAIAKSPTGRNPSPSPRHTLAGVEDPQEGSQSAHRFTSHSSPVNGSPPDDEDEGGEGPESLYTPRPHIISPDLAQADTTAARMILAVSTIAQLKTELNTSRNRVNDLLTMKSLTLRAAVGRLSDVFSTICASYTHPSFQDCMLSFNHPAGRWFIGYGDTDDSTPYPYLRAVGRQRNQRFSLGAVKFHIHTFFAQSPPSWRAATGGAGELLGDRLQRWMDARYPTEAASMCYSFHSSLDWFSTTDADCYLVKSILDGELDESTWRRAALAVGKLRTEMERLQAQLQVTNDPSARMSTAAAVDEILNDKGSNNSPTEGTSRSAAAGDIRKRRISATFINEKGLPERCLVTTPKNVNADLAIKAIANVFGLWSEESISDLIRALENTSDAASEAAAQALASKERFNHRKSLLTAVPISSAQAASLRGTNTPLSLSSIFDPVSVSGGQMESYFSSAVRTLWLVEGYQFTTDIVECVLEKSAAAAGRVTPQMLVSAVLEADSDCPDHILHELCENTFIEIRPNGLPVPDDSKEAPMIDRYLRFGDVTIPLRWCIAKLRKAGPLRHTPRQQYLQHLHHRSNTHLSTSPGGAILPSQSNLSTAR